MKPYILTILFLHGSLLTGTALACNPPSPPSLPDPATAVLAEMVKAKGDVQKFINAGDEYLECENNRVRYNRMIDLMQQTGDEFNKKIRQFKELKSR